SPFDRFQALEPALLALLHRPVEGTALLGMSLQPGPEIAAEAGLEPRFAGRVQVRQGLVEDTAEEVREIGPPAAKPGRGPGVPEAAGLLLGEEAFARERAQEPVQRVGVSVDFAGDLCDRAGPLRQRLGHAELRHDRDRARAERASEQVPERVLRTLAHPVRQASTRTAASSASASV